LLTVTEHSQRLSAIQVYLELLYHITKTHSSAEATECHLPYGITSDTSHTTQVNAPNCNRSQTVQYTFYLLQRDGRLS